MRKYGCRGMFLAFASALMLLVSGVSARAEESSGGAVPEDPDRTGSVTVTLTDQTSKVLVTAGTIRLCRVADVSSENGSLSFSYTEEFSGCTEPLADLSDAEELAEKFAAYASSVNADMQETSADADGLFVFRDLAQGLYLVRQGKNASGYKAISPFLVTVPMKDEAGNGWVYDIDAKPKVETASSSTSRRNSRSSGGGGSSYTTPGGSTPAEGQTPETAPGGELSPIVQPDEKLPQTGQLNWPVPCLAVGGVLLFAVGWWLTFGKDRNDA